MDNFTVLSIPEISNERQIWLIRTNGGLYYNDFTTNKYVALGWDAVSVDLLLNSSISNDAKKEKINELYPDEKRPGLIFSQLYNFHCVMNNGDLVLIPIYQVMKFIDDDSLVDLLVNKILSIQGKGSPMLKSLKKQLVQTDTAIENILNAIEQGIITKSTKKRLDEL